MNGKRKAQKLTQALRKNLLRRKKHRNITTLSAHEVTMLQDVVSYLCGTTLSSAGFCDEESNRYMLVFMKSLHGEATPVELYIDKVQSVRSCVSIPKKAILKNVTFHTLDSKGGQLMILLSQGDGIELAVSMLDIRLQECKAQ